MNINNLFDNHLKVNFDIWEILNGHGSATLIVVGKELECACRISECKIELSHTTDIVGNPIDFHSLASMLPLKLKVGNQEWIMPDNSLSFLNISSEFNAEGAKEIPTLSVNRLLTPGFDPEKRSFYRLIFPFSGRRWSWNEVECLSYKEGRYENC